MADAGAMLDDYVTRTLRSMESVADDHWIDFSQSFGLPTVERVNLPTLSRSGAADSTGHGLDEHMEQSRLAQRQADKWLISGSMLIGTAALGIFGLPLFLRGVWLLRQAQRDGLSVRPMLVTLLGYLVIIDAAINTVGWALDMVANHTLLARVLSDRVGQHVRRRLLLALQRAMDRRRRGPG